MSGKAGERSFSRRGLLGGLATLPLLVGGARQAPSGGSRAARAYGVRLEAARRMREAGDPRHVTNGDEIALSNHLATFSKGLPHDARGEVDPKAMVFLLRALASGSPTDFESIPLGGFTKLANPQAAWAFELVGPDASQPQISPPPHFGSAEQAAEMAELYWQALCRDVPFTEYSSHPLPERAAADLSRLTGFRGPKAGERATPETLFRGAAAGDLAGPYLSQFLWKSLPLAPLKVEQKIRTVAGGVDYLTRWDEWLSVENGALVGVSRFDEVPRFLRNGRDLAEYVHRDFTYQAFLGACLAALKWGVLPDGGNPYKHSRTQGAFATFGAPFLLSLLGTVTQAALKACWYQKWRVHRRLRPEELGGRAEAQRQGKASYPLHSELFQCAALAEVVQRWGSALLAQAYPEACPTHPSYPAGHAVIAGACATVLKAAFDESFLVPEPVEANAEGTELRPWRGAGLRVGGELDKLASNIAYGRNFAGVHWRSDSAAGLALGEAVALEVLAEQAYTGNELFAGYTLRGLDGKKISVP